MPLDPEKLQSDLEEFFADPPVVLGADGAVDEAGTKAACGARWGSIMGSYAAGITPPSTTVSAASTQLGSDMALVMDGNDPVSSAAGVELAFATFAASVGAGMALAVPPFTATPPGGAVGFALQLATPQETHAKAAAEFAALIHKWMGTGTAVPASGGPSVPWI